jgi:hypothetical protein
MEFEYRKLERALAAAMTIAPEQMAAFRARLRHLRNLGIPDTPQPGSGRRVTYSLAHALEMLLALELESLGKAPRVAARVARAILRTSGGLVSDDQQLFITFDRADSMAYTVLLGRKAFRKWLRSPPRSFAVVDVTTCAKVLDAALQKHEGVRPLRDARSVSRTKKQ